MSQKVLDAIATVLDFISPGNEFTKQSPQRILKFYENFFHKYKNVDLEKVVKKSIKTLASQGIRDSQEIIFDGIDFVSFCEHHLLKFEGSVEISYTPSNYIVGFDTICIIVDYFASNLQIQERLTENILDFIVKTIKPQSCSVKIIAKHDCMRLRGQEKKSASITTIKKYQKQNSINKK